MKRAPWTLAERDTGLEIRVPALCTKMGPLVCYTFSVPEPVNDNGTLYGIN